MLKIITPLLLGALVISLFSCSFGRKNKDSRPDIAPNQPTSNVHQPTNPAGRPPSPMPMNPNFRGRDGRISAEKLSYSSAAVGGGKYIAMTFDDGPHPRNTPRLLDILKRRNVKATFYVVGPNAKRYPAIMQRIVAEGHEIGNHTMTHRKLRGLPDSVVKQELQETHDIILQVTGKAPRSFRPPYGAFDTAQRQMIFNEFGYPTVLWNVDPEDWKRPGVSVVTRRLIDGARPGGILLAHDIHSPTIDAMPSTLNGLLNRGYQFVTFSQLVGLEKANGGGQLASFTVDDLKES